MAVDQLNGTESPALGFAAGEFEGFSDAGEFEGIADRASWLESPFAGASETETPAEAEALEAVVAEFEDHEFQEAIQGLIDGMAAQHLSVLNVSSEADGTARADREVQALAEALAQEGDRLFEHLDAQFGERSVETLAEGELEAATANFYAEQGGANLVGEEFFGKLIKKIGKGIGNVVKKGISLVGKLLPFGKLLEVLKKLAKAVLKRVLLFAINKLPMALRGPASQLAKRLFGEQAQVTEAEMIATEFDARLAEALTATNEADMRQFAAEFEGESAQASLAGFDETSNLDAARARLSDQLLEATPGEAPVAQMEEFIPAVIGAVKLGISILGRDKVVNTLGGLLANLIRNYVGSPMAKALGASVADVGMRFIGLEAEGEGGVERIGAEALVGTLEDTIREVAQLPQEALAEPARLEAEVRYAFNEAAARHLPREVLRSDLETFETEDLAGTWVYMPRGPGRRYRYKKFANVFRVPVTQQTARVIVLSDGDTLERRLLDSGVRMWPAQAEVQLYETLPGTQLGHLSAFESDREEEAVPGAAESEYEELTPLAAAALLRQPALGRAVRAALGAGIARPAGHGVGTRLFALRGNGRRMRRRHKRLLVRLARRDGAIQLRTHLRLSEREAIAARGNPASVAMIVRTRSEALVAGLATRIEARAARYLRVNLTQREAHAIASTAVQSILTKLTRDIATVAPEVATAAANPLAGVTLTFDFTVATVDALRGGALGTPSVQIRPGYMSD
jgi:hypothetical protein